jgi:hypothetical protein
MTYSCPLGGVHAFAHDKFGSLEVVELFIDAQQLYFVLILNIISFWEGLTNLRERTFLSSPSSAIILSY